MARKIPSILNEDETQRLLAVPNLRTPTGLRNRCILELMLYAGLRNTEVRGLRVGDIDWMSGRMHVTGKGDRDRVLWLNESTLNLLRRWRGIRPHNEDGLLFTTLKGGQIWDTYLRAMVKRYANRAGISKRTYPHLLRHMFCTALLRQTKNLRLVQRAAGHADISTTTIYTHIVDDELETAMRSMRGR